MGTLVRRMRHDLRERLGYWWYLVWFLLALLAVAVFLARVPVL